MPYKLQICNVITYTTVTWVYRFKTYHMPLEITAKQIDRNLSCRGEAIIRLLPLQLQTWRTSLWISWLFYL